MYALLIFNITLKKKAYYICYMDRKQISKRAYTVRGITRKTIKMHFYLTQLKQEDKTNYCKIFKKTN